MAGAAVLAPWVLASVELGLLGHARSSRRLGRDVGPGGGLEGGRLCRWWLVAVRWCLLVCASGSPLCFYTVPVYVCVVLLPGVSVYIIYLYDY